MDHSREATAIEFPDGRLVKSFVGSQFENGWRVDEQALSFALCVRLKDVRLLAEELGRLNTYANASIRKHRHRCVYARAHQNRLVR